MQIKYLLLGTLVLLMASLAQAQPFTYQGFLKVSGNPANGAYDFEFRLYGVASGGVQVGPTVSVNDLNVQSGLFTVELNFGSVWDGSDRYLEVWVRPGSSTGGYQQLLPRVKLTRAPYAARADAAPPVGAAGGDLSGVYPDPAVARLQGRAVSSAAPSSGQVLKWDGSAWAPAADLRDAFWQGSGSYIFYNAGNVGIGTSTIDTARLNVAADSTTSNATLRLHETAADFARLEFTNTNTARKWHIAGLIGSTAADDRLNFWNSSAGDVLSMTGDGRVGIGTAAPAYKLHVSTNTTERAIYGHHTATSGSAWGVHGRSDSVSGIGVYGLASATSGSAWGVHGRSDSTSGAGVYGVATATIGFTYGVMGQSASASGRGVYGGATATSGGAAGVEGRSASDSGTGVFGWATAASGDTYGVHGLSASTNGKGVFGSATATSGLTRGVEGRSASTTGIGVYGLATATSGDNYGVFGRSDSPSGTGVYGSAAATTGGTGVEGRSNTGTGVFGFSASTSGGTRGVYGLSQGPSGMGVHGYANHYTGAPYGVFGEVASPNGYGVYSYGRFAATGTKAFQIDHPLDPENFFLNHFCTEGPEPMNAYSGNVVTDANGYATVTLPVYFESINRDFRYQLTVIDNSEDFVLAKVVQEIQYNRFVIRTSKPFVRVSWRVEATRNDLYVQRYGFQTEQEKEDDIKGKYLQPELYGQPKERGIHYRPEPERPSEIEKPRE